MEVEMFPPQKSKPWRFSKFFGSYGPHKVSLEAASQQEKRLKGLKVSVGKMWTFFYRCSTWTFFVGSTQKGWFLGGKDPDLLKKVCFSFGGQKRRSWFDGWIWRNPIHLCICRTESKISPELCPILEAALWTRCFRSHVLNHPKVRGKWFNFEHQVMQGFNHIFESDS